MSKTSEAQKKAVKKYDEKSKYIHLKFTDNQTDDYYRIRQYCDENGLSMQGYIKSVILHDLDNKNVWA